MGKIQQQFSQKDCELIAREPCFKGFFKVDRIELRHKLFGGGWSPLLRREIFIRADATCVLPYDPMEGTVVLVEQFRAPVIGQEQSPWLIELVAGMNEVGECPKDVAVREAKEEADLSLLELEPIMEYLVSPGGSTEKVYLYCAKIDSRDVSGVHGLEEENEDIKVHVVSVEVALAMLESGQINNAAAIISLQWLALNKEKLDARWM
jgi:ADP-ribose pyrophosphatase|tara:strand:+ start:686 stop:1306 length:621 start_codon:yes stop_codon:yes gene_type:complete